MAVHAPLLTRALVLVSQFLQSASEMFQGFLSSMAGLRSPLSSYRTTGTYEGIPILQIMSYQDARPFLDTVGPWLRVEERASNTILPRAEMALWSQVEDQPQRRSDRDLLWVVCCSRSTPDPSPIGDQTSQAPGSLVIPFTSTPQIRLIVQAGNIAGGAGDDASSLSLCLFAPNMLNAPTASDQLLADAMRATAVRLAQLHSPSRVRSLFGPAPLVHAFSLVWDASGDETTRASIRRRFNLLRYPPNSASDARDLGSVVPNDALSARQATEHDIPALANLYRDACSGAPPWYQTGAEDHLSTLVTASNVWISEVQEGSDADGVVAFCEVGRRGQSLAAVTALYTIPGLRRRGFGSYILSGVLQSLLATGITSVVAYSPVDTLPSECVFRRVGFTAADDTEWLEVGYVA